MSWQSSLGAASVVVSLATFVGIGGVGIGGGAGPVHAASAASAAATSEPRFVREAQRTLGELGYRPGPIDGVVGRRTQSALAAYQRSEGIPVTGHLDAETLVRLDIHRRVSPAVDRRESELGARPPGATVARH
jgi:Putative peptidoglycan binding domain